MEWKSRAQLLPGEHQPHLPWGTAAGFHLARGHPGCQGFAPKWEQAETFSVMGALKVVVQNLPQHSSILSWASWSHPVPISSSTFGGPLLVPLLQPTN